MYLFQQLVVSRQGRHRVSLSLTMMAPHVLTSLLLLACLFQIITALSLGGTNIDRCG
jgi:hypothetical protein